jgi:hypothetical protein
MAGKAKEKPEHPAPLLSIIIIIYMAFRKEFI